MAMASPSQRDVSPVEQLRRSPRLVLPRFCLETAPLHPESFFFIFFPGAASPYGPYLSPGGSAARPSTRGPTPAAALCGGDHGEDGKMSMIDVLTRVDAICKKYERYDADKHRNDAADPFSRLYADMDAVIDGAIEKSERAARETNRAAAVTLNAGVRRTKARLLEEVAKLQKLAGKKMKGVSPEEMALRPDLVSALHQRIQSIPDGGGTADQNGGGNTRPGIKFDSSGE
ncbi:hypothetical protein TRIUR3_32309 [Triticum urartu]|uniref:Syntaxin-71 n=1 Tax=Triticum urartu TaxID=4572 RepID=M7ZQZ5_TRIUA|nr:hypothetical protein TRIUR3_32309 [Triticum urartu]